MDLNIELFRNPPVQSTLASCIILFFFFEKKNKSFVRMFRLTGELALIQTYFFSLPNTIFWNGSTRPLIVTRFGSNSKSHSRNVGVVRCASAIRLLKSKSFSMRVAGPNFVCSATAFIALHKINIYFGVDVNENNFT